MPREKLPRHFEGLLPVGAITTPVGRQGKHHPLMAPPQVSQQSEARRDEAPGPRSKGGPVAEGGIQITQSRLAIAKWAEVPMEVDSSYSNTTLPPARHGGRGFAFSSWKPAPEPGSWVGRVRKGWA